MKTREPMKTWPVNCGAQAQTTEQFRKTTAIRRVGSSTRAPDKPSTGTEMDLYGLMTRHFDGSINEALQDVIENKGG
jgi:hypothetical protein